MNRSARRAAALLTIAALAGTISLSSIPSAAAAPVPGDYNGNGRSDVAVGAVYRAGPSQPGAVFTRDILSGTLGDHRIEKAGEQESGEDLGETVASCNLNGDRYADLVAATSFGPGEHGVQVFLGSARGLEPAQRLVETFDLNTEVAAIACGDVNGDGYDEVATGYPTRTAVGQGRAGLVRLYHGGADGPSTTGRLYVSQEFPGLPGISETFDYFGAALAFGDLDGDRYDELVVGIPNEQSPGATEENLRDGAVAILYGSAGGLSTTRSAVLFGNRLKAGGKFGLAVAAGDITGDGRDDLVVGAPLHVVGGVPLGAVALVKGRGGAPALDQLVSQADPLVPGPTDQVNAFGAVLALGDITGDGRDDLAVGAPGQPVSGFLGAGSLTVLPGSRSGLIRSRSQMVTVASPGVPGIAALVDNFPGALTVRDTSGDGRAEVYATFNPYRRLQAVYGFPGSRTGIVPAQTVRFYQRDLQRPRDDKLTFARSLG